MDRFLSTTLFLLALAALGGACLLLLGRAWLHHQLVAERNHAHRAAITMAVRDEQNLMDALPEALARSLARSLARLARRADDAEFRAELTELIDQVLAEDLTAPDQPV